MKYRVMKIVEEEIEGITFKDLQKEIPELTKPTFRKWLQCSLIPNAVGYIINSTGKTAIYPLGIVKIIRDNTTVSIRWNKNSK
jgi:hypothetical protein